MTTPTRPMTAEVERSGSRAVIVEWPGERPVALNVLWLRDNCPSGGDKLSAIRSFSLGDLDPDLTIAAAAVGGDGALRVDFSDGHRSVFDAGWLATHARPATRRSAGAVTRWRSGVELPRFGHPDIADTDTHRQLLEALVSHGAAIVDGVPTDLEGSESLAARLGPVRETDFGRFFDIVSEPDVWEMSQSTEALDPHTDDPYRYTPSGVSVLHCVEAGAGGRSTLVDGFAVADAIRDATPDAFALLSSVAMPWVRHRPAGVDQGAAVDLRAEASVIRLDRDGEVCGIRFHERSLGTLDVDAGDPDLVDACYRALIEFVRRISDPEFQLQRQLVPGEALVFDNQRVLHGRTSFTAEAGRRHLRLCTVDRELVHSNLRLLRQRCSSGGADDRLPSGNLS